MKHLSSAVCRAGCAATLVIAGAALAAESESDLDVVVVTVTKSPEPADRIPADLSVISGRELLARGATDLAQALSLVPGVEAPAGGDAGPSSAVPSFWGLHEFDAFLLVVDGIPWGGAYSPSITTLDFTDVQRVEVLKGAAPVMFGATSFVGVVHEIHYPAGQASEEADLAYGTYGSVRGSISATLPRVGNYAQSIAIEGQNLGFSDPRQVVSNERGLYRGALDLGDEQLTLDADVTHIHDVPSSPVLRAGSELTALTPIDANFNPANARIDQNQYHLSLGYSAPNAWGRWETLLSYAHSVITDVRAFLHPDLSGTADTQNQHRLIDDAYLDTHLTNQSLASVTIVGGADLLYGHGRQTSLNGNDAYTVPLDGSVIPPLTYTIPVTEVGMVDDRRAFVGQYIQADWKPDDTWDFVAGLRMNETYEHKSSSDLVLPPPVLASETVSKTMLRATETVGVSYRAWSRADDELVLYADYRNAFKPAAIDFGPDYTPDLLSPETAQSGEAGLKGVGAGGALTWQTELFLMDFKNLVVATSSGALANAAGERLKGAEAEARFTIRPDLALVASASYHDASFSHYLFFDGTSNVDVAGRQLTLSPHVLAAAGLMYTPATGFGSTAVVRYVGSRFLDEENTARVGGYTTIDANVSYTLDRACLSVEGTNLTNQRPPVTGSEFGSQSFYLLPARMLWLRLQYSWRS